MHEHMHRFTQTSAQYMETVFLLIFAHPYQEKLQVHGNI